MKRILLIIIILTTVTAIYGAIGNDVKVASADHRPAHRSTTKDSVVNKGYILADTITSNPEEEIITSNPEELEYDIPTYKDEDDVTTLGEVVVTAREGNGMTSSSRIDRAAMEHLQPTSFTDLLELLPGNISQTPDMGKANTITLRETGGVSATGAKTDVSDDYAITSLGTAFIVDGAPVNNDAALQGVPSASSSDPEGKRSVINKGVDMRTISTDNIESVEIVRGIPSAEYGNLTSGLVNIRRIRKAIPFTARVKVDEYSKLISLGKGLRIGKQILNIDAGYLDSKTDPRDTRENYKRLNGSIRGNLAFGNPDSAVETDLSIGADYVGSFDNVKPDPDLNYNKIDEYSSSYNRWALTSALVFKLHKCNWLETAGINASVSYEKSRLTRQKQVAPVRASVAPISNEEGVHDGVYLLSEYIADYVSDGQPFTLFLKGNAGGRQKVWNTTHRYKGGLEFSLTKNFGYGQIYDPYRPLSASWTTRPRAYRDIPALNMVSAWIEDNILIPIRENTIEIQAGVRTQSLVGLDKKYLLNGKVYLDPRVNAVWKSPYYDAGAESLRITGAVGYGVTTRMPTVDYLFPQKQYLDFIQLNYYDITNPAEYSRVNLRTYIADPTNYDLKAARNRKIELRMGLDWGANSLTVTLFDERLRSGFRYSTVYDAYQITRYDPSVIIPGTLTAPPSLTDLPAQDMNILGGYRKVTNGSRIDKQGVEFQFNSARWQAIGTALIINGAWFRSRYSNSRMLFIPVSDVVGSTPVKEKYVGLYDTEEGRINEQFNTNFMFDTQIPRWGLIFTTSVQCLWYVRTTRLRDASIPTMYISAEDGVLHNYNPEDAQDILLQYLIRNINETAYKPQTVPPAIYLNLKATKKIGKFLRISAFINRIVDYLPTYTVNGLTIRRNSGVYFGMEANFTF